MTLVMAKARAGRLVLRFLRPLYAWRGRIIGRKFGGRPRFYDAAARRWCEAIVGIFEMWEAQPGLDRMRAIADDLDAMAGRMQRLVDDARRSETDPNQETKR